MFASGDAEPTPRLARILDVIGEVLQTVKNGVIISGHTDGQVLKRGTYSNWELSSDRSNSVNPDCARFEKANSGMERKHVGVSRSLGLRRTFRRTGVKLRQVTESGV